MRTPSALRIARRLPALLALALACQAQQPAPAPKPTPAAQPAPTPAPEIAAPTPAPDEPTPPPIAIPEGCKVIIEGEGGDTVKRALVNTTAGGLYDTTVADGRVIEFECPPVAERKGANIIAEKSNAELVHWAGVDLAPGDQAQPLAAADAKPDLPAGLDEQTLARLRAKWPDLSKWEEPAVDEAPAGPEQPAAPADKIPVSFSAHQLYWAELRLEHRASNKQLRVVLDPKASKSLVPGVYALSVKIEDTGDWIDAGELVIEVGKGKYTVKMLDNPPRPQVSSN